MRVRIYSFVAKRNPSPLKQIFSLTRLSTLATVIIAAFAVKVSIEQMVVSNTTSAKGVYKEYLTLALANPKYAGASNPLWAPRYLRFKYGSDEREAYEFFVSLLLNSVDEILSTPEKNYWKETLVIQLSYHALYLNAREFVPDSYLCETRELVVQGIEKYVEKQRGYSLLMNPIKLNDRIQCTDEEWRREESD